MLFFFAFVFDKLDLGSKKGLLMYRFGFNNQGEKKKKTRPGLSDVYPNTRFRFCSCPGLPEHESKGKHSGKKGPRSLLLHICNVQFLNIS